MSRYVRNGVVTSMRGRCVAVAFVALAHVAACSDDGGGGLRDMGPVDGSDAGSGDVAMSSDTDAEEAQDTSREDDLGRDVGTDFATEDGGPDDGGSIDAASEDVGTDAGMLCDPTLITNVSPADGATDVHYRTTIDITFSATPQNALGLKLEGPGPDVTLTSQWIGDLLTVEPAQPLDPNTSYTFSVCGTSYQWTTGDLGGPLMSSVDLTGRAYVLDLSAARFVEPPGIGSILSGFLDQEALLGVEAVATDSLTMIGGRAATGASPPVQASCQSTTIFPVDADFTQSPYFEMASTDDPLIFWESGLPQELHHWSYSGTFSPSADRVSGVRIEGHLDTEPFVPLVDPGCDDPSSSNHPCDPNEVCALYASLGVNCETCPHDTSRDLCLKFRIDSLEGTYRDDLTLERLHHPDGPLHPQSSDSYCTKNACSSLPECTN